MILRKGKVENGNSGCIMPESHPKEKRGSDRIAVAMPIQIRGTDGRGKRFEEPTKTIEISRDGGKFGSRTSLRSNQKIHIRNQRRDTEALFRAVGPLPGPDRNEAYWGAECLEPSPGFWGIYFPPITEAEEAAARILLQCGGCKTQELSYLSDLETEVFSLNQKIHRHCEAYGDWTERLTPEPGTEGEGPLAVPSQRGKERRMNRRIKLHMAAWILTREGQEEVVDSVSVSAGGLAVKTKKNHPKGSLLKIAFPYHPGGANIVVLGRVVRVSATEDPSVQLHGLQYLRWRTSASF